MTTITSVDVLDIRFPTSRTLGKAVLMVSSYLRELFGLCDRLAVMSRGRLSDARPIAEWTPQSVLAAAIGAAAAAA